MSRQSSSQTGGEGGNDCPDDTAEILTEGLEEGDGDGARGDGDGDDVMEVGGEAEEAGEPEAVGTRVTDRRVFEWMEQRVFVAWYNMKHGISEKDTQGALIKWGELADNPKIRSKKLGEKLVLLVNK